MCQNHQSGAGTDPHHTSAPDVASEAGSRCGAHTPAPLAAAPAATAEDDVAQCQVMPGSTVSKAAAEAAGLYRDHNGQRYWFCCAGCAPLWDADPARYAAA